MSVKVYHDACCGVNTECTIPITIMQPPQQQVVTKQVVQAPQNWLPVAAEHVHFDVPVTKPSDHVYASQVLRVPEASGPQGQPPAMQGPSAAAPQEPVAAASQLSLIHI